MSIRSEFKKMHKKAHTRYLAQAKQYGFEFYNQSCYDNLVRHLMGNSSLTYKFPDAESDARMDRIRQISLNASSSLDDYFSLIDQFPNFRKKEIKARPLISTSRFTCAFPDLHAKSLQEGKKLSGFGSYGNFIYYIRESKKRLESKV